MACGAEPADLHIHSGFDSSIDVTHCVVAHVDSVESLRRISSPSMNAPDKRIVATVRQATSEDLPVDSTVWWDYQSIAPAPAGPGDLVILRLGGDNAPVSASVDTAHTKELGTDPRCR